MIGKTSEIVTQLFDSYHELERFIARYKNIQIIDIKFSTSVRQNGNTLHSFLVICKDGTQ